MYMNENEIQIKANKTTIKILQIEILNKVYIGRVNKECRKFVSQISHPMSWGINTAIRHHVNKGSPETTPHNG